MGASKALRESGLIPVEECEVAEEIQEGVAVVQKGTLVAASVASKLANGIAWGAGWAAAKVHDVAHHELSKIKSEQWHEDAKTLAAASLDAGAGVVSSLMSAPCRAAGDIADASCEVIGHRYGEDAGAVARDGAQLVGNVLTVAS